MAEILQETMLLCRRRSAFMLVISIVRLQGLEQAVASCMTICDVGLADNMASHRSFAAAGNLCSQWGRVRCHAASAEPDVQ